MISYILTTIATLLTCVSCVSASAETDQNLMLILNMENEFKLPKTFRMSTDPLKEIAWPLPSTKGLPELQASASGQFSEKGLQKILSLLPTKEVLIIDLREESHGYVDGMAISWYGKYDWGNVGKTRTEIVQDEHHRLNEISQNGYFILSTEFSPLIIHAKKAYNEATLAEKNGVDYVRLPNTDHVRPTDATVDKFITLIANKPKNVWLHFHCAAGKGRATTFFVLYDMLQNAKDISFDDIISRQALIGGKDLLVPAEPGAWKYPYSLERIEFIKKFYRFAKERKEGESWTSWLARKPA